MSKHDRVQAQELTGFPENIASALSGREQSAPRALAASHPRIVETMGALWGKEREFKAYIDDLAFNDRADERQGFEPAVLQDIFFMKELHEAMHGRGTLDISKNGRGPDIRQDKTMLGRVSKTKDPKVDEAAHWLLERDLMRVKARMEAKRMGKAATVPKMLGEILVDAGAVEPNRLEAALRAQVAGGKKTLLGAILAKAGLAKLDDIQRALCIQQGAILLDLDAMGYDSAAAGKIPRELELERKLVAVAVNSGATLVAMSNPADYKDMEWLGFVVGGPIELAWASSTSIDRRLAGIKPAREESSTRASEVSQDFKAMAKVAAKPLAERKAQQAAMIELARKGAVGAEDPTVADMVRKMVLDAKKLGASDIHVEAGPKSAYAHVRMRIDGEMSDYAQYEKAAHEAVVSRIKISADLDISERRRPQDGKMSVQGEKSERLEARVSTIPSVGGFEAVTLRLISAAEPVDLARGFEDKEHLELVESLLESPHGLVLVCGPTGSGKTTTLHSMLSRLNTPSKKIWTVEDPVEIVQEGLVQTQALPKIGYGFDAAIRAFMRADPDVIMVGEIRDGQTASAALEAALTGHLVLSTLHTNSACETAARLLDLGSDSFALSDALRGIVAQRLGRRLCSCARERRATPAELDEIAREHFLSMGNPRSSRSDRDRWVGEMRKSMGGDISIKEPVGCAACRNSGHAGRVGVHEVLVVSESIKRVLSAKGSASELLKVALSEGFKPLRARALELACLGVISISEARSLAL